MSNNVGKVEISAADITDRLVGITPSYFQNFIQRGSYGLRASIASGKSRSQRRIFSVDDVFGFALVWLLFESGLRGDPIARILNDIAGTKTANANLAAKKLLELDAEYILVRRQPRRPAKTSTIKPIQKTEILKKSESHRLSQSDFIELLIPVGYKFRDIKSRIAILF